MKRSLNVFMAIVATAGLLAASARVNDAGKSKPTSPAVRLPATQPSTKPTADTTQHYPAPPAPPLSPDKERATFALPPGYQIELVASEPRVQDPITIAFDADGRMWVCEMRDYMPDVYAHNEDAPTGRISVLESTRGDGHYDKATVFLDHLVLPRAVSPIAGGVLVAAPPHLWFCQDTTGGLHCDRQTEIYGKFGVARDPEYGDNGLLYARDNWIYNANSTLRFRHIGGDRFQSSPTAHRGQWGISQDDVGRLYFNYNSDQLRADLIPTEYLARNPRYKAAAANYQVETDQHVWPSRPNPGINRGYEPGNLRKDGTLNTVTATCGPAIFRGTALGEDAYGNAFIPEPAGNLVMRKTLAQGPDGMVKAHSVLHPGNGPDGKLDFLTSTDERFRPVDAFTSPDGALYIVDMYRGLIQHRTYVMPYLRNQVFERGLEQPLHQGRIWRIFKEGQRLTALPRMSKEAAAQLVGHLSSPNGWWRDTAQRLLVERNDPASISLLRKLAMSGASPLGRLHALWTLDGMGKTDEATLAAALHDHDARVCSAAIRLSEPLLGQSDGKMLAQVLKLAGRADVRLQFVLSLSGVKTDKADEAMASALAESADSPFIRDAAISGMAGRELDFLQLLLTEPSWARETTGRRALIGALANCVLREGKGAVVSQLLETAALEKGETHWRQMAILEGLTAVAKGQGKPRPVALAAVPQPLLKLVDDPDKQTAQLAKAAQAMVSWPGKPVAARKPAVKLDVAGQASFERGKTLFTAICAQCHQLDGRGFEGKAPSLRDSPIALGPDIRPIRVVLNGAKGEFHVVGWTPNLEMPTLSVLDDQQIADALTYIRHAWGHGAAAVHPATVAGVRSRVAGRQAAWTEPELLAVPDPNKKQGK
ncbi:MAG TPA: PVC-type heme-binding CxxCH protein [Tepidisphaeraceae bacterium]|nr:PVC-type heme-binding CxxCH protein [Tepidisphaeraceae bacterium]